MNTTASVSQFQMKRWLAKSFPQTQSRRSLHNLQWNHPPPTARPSLSSSADLHNNLSFLALQGRLRDAISLLRDHDIPGATIASDTYLRLIRPCIRFKAFSEGRTIHEHIVKSGITPDLALQNNIMMLYSDSGEVDLARQVFDGMRERNLFSWTAIVGAYLNSGHPDNAFDFYLQMVAEGVRADEFLFPLVCKSCTAMNDLDKGRRVHADILRHGWQSDSVVTNSLLDVYMKCECVDDAERLFDEAPVRDAYTWTAIVTGYVRAGRGGKALNLFREMLFSDVKPHSATLVGILPLFSDLGYLQPLKQIHGLVVAIGLGFNKFVGSALINAYCCCAALGFGRLVFDGLPDKDLACWNAMITGYVHVMLFDEAVDLLSNMHSPAKPVLDGIMSYLIETGSVKDALGMLSRLEGVGIDLGLISLSTLLHIGELASDIQHVNELHYYLKKTRYISNSGTTSALIGLFSKFSDIDMARVVFDSFHMKDLCLWNSMISCYADAGHINKALELLDLMQTFGTKPSRKIWNSIISSFVRREDFESALESFSKLRFQNIKPDAKCYEIILPAVSSLTCPWKGKQLHGVFIRNACKMTTVANAAFISMYCNCGDAAYAAKVYELMDFRDAELWNMIMDKLEKTGMDRQDIRNIQ